ncbi:MAG TPA: glycosyltransferase family 2 protein [Terriglobales bacterium]
MATAAIVQTYLIALGRSPEPSAVQRWTTFLHSGHSLADMVSEIASSAEFNGLHGSAANCNFHTIRTLFRKASGKKLTKAEAARVVAYWLMRRPAKDVVLSLCKARTAQFGSHMFPLLYPNSARPMNSEAYRIWVQDFETDQRERIDGPQSRNDVERSTRQPTISIFMDCSTTDLCAATKSIESLRSQSCQNWELVIVAGACDSKPALERLQELASDSPQIKLLVSPADDSETLPHNAILDAATGEFAAWLDAGDILNSFAILEVVRELQANPGSMLLYTDEDLIDAEGQRSSPAFKTSWNVDLLLAGDWVGGLAVYRVSRVREVGGLRADRHPFERFDLLMRFVESLDPALIRHIPKLLYHRREHDPARIPRFPEALANVGTPAMKSVVERNLYASGSKVEIKGAFLGGRIWPHPVFPVPSPAPLVSIIIPTRDMPDLLGQCIQGLLHRTDYSNLEILVIDNDSSAIGTRLFFAQIAAHERVRVLPFPGDFNWSAANNFGAKAANGSVLLFLNNDIDVTNSDWLREMVSHAIRPSVGIVGAKLYYKDDRLQHGGMMLDNRGNCLHLYRFADPGEPGYLGQLALTRDVSAVTGACLAVRKEVFEELGGFEEQHLKVTWSDVDLCLRAYKHKYRVVWTPFAELRHLECATRGFDTTPERIKRFHKEQEYMSKTWGTRLCEDPFVNPNLTATETGLYLSPRFDHRGQNDTGKRRGRIAVQRPA